MIRGSTVVLALFVLPDESVTVSTTSCEPMVCHETKIELFWPYKVPSRLHAHNETSWSSLLLSQLSVNASLTSKRQPPALGWPFPPIRATGSTTSLTSIDAVVEAISPVGETTQSVTVRSPGVAQLAVASQPVASASLLAVPSLSESTDASKSHRAESI